jgi:hypothetical protein
VERRTRDEPSRRFGGPVPLLRDLRQFQSGRGAKELIMGLILLIILILLLLGAVPSWPYSRNWGYGPSGVLGLLLVVLLVLLIFDVIRFTI